MICEGQACFFLRGCCLDNARMCCILSVVRNANASYIPGTATLRRIFSPGSHTIRAVYDGTVSEQTSSSASLLTVASGAGTPSAGLIYGTTVYFGQSILGRFGGYRLLTDFNNDGVLYLIVPQSGMQNIGTLLWRHNPSENVSSANSHSYCDIR